VVIPTASQNLWGSGIPGSPSEYAPDLKKSFANSRFIYFIRFYSSNLKVCRPLDPTGVLSLKASKRLPANI